MLPELTEKQRDSREHIVNDKLCFDFAGASGTRVGPSGRAQKFKALDGLVFAYVGFRISLDVIRDLKMYLKFHLLALGAAGGIWTFCGRLEKWLRKGAARNSGRCGPASLLFLKDYSMSD